MLFNFALACNSHRSVDRISTCLSDQNMTPTTLGSVDLMASPYKMSKMPRNPLTRHVYHHQMPRMRSSCQSWPAVASKKASFRASLSFPLGAPNIGPSNTDYIAYVVLS